MSARDSKAITKDSKTVGISEVMSTTAGAPKIDAGKASRDPSTDLQDQWNRVRSRLRAELGEATFSSWFKSLEVSGAQRGRVTLRVPTRFVRSWIEAHYLTRIRKHWQA